LITGEKFGNLKSCLATYDRGGEWWSGLFWFQIQIHDR
jgi:hypothetical protein